jgi:hypothetical protein
MVLILLTESSIQSDITSYRDDCVHTVHPKAVVTYIQSLHSVMRLHSAISFQTELMIIRKPLPFGLDFNSVTCALVQHYPYPENV